jgi:hypothetical protein
MGILFQNISILIAFFSFAFWQNFAPKKKKKLCENFGKKSKKTNHNF